MKDRTLYDLNDEVIFVPKDVLPGTNQIVLSIFAFELRDTCLLHLASTQALYPTLEAIQLSRMTSQDHTALCKVIDLHI